MRKIFLLLIPVFAFSGFESFSQDSVVIVSRKDISHYRNGYIVTSAYDTVHGLIWHENDGGIYFIKAGTRVKTPMVGNFTTIPFISASDGSIKSFYRNGLFYEIHKVPPYDSPTFLNVLETGKMTLYKLICNYEDARKVDNFSMFGGLTGAFVGAMASSKDNPDDEYYSLKAYYIQKGNAEPLVLIPKGDKNFREAFYPLVKDNSGFLKGVVGQSFDYFHIRDLVQLYNSTRNSK